MGVNKGPYLKVGDIVIMDGVRVLVEKGACHTCEFYRKRDRFDIGVCRVSVLCSDYLPTRCHFANVEEGL